MVQLNLNHTVDELDLTWREFQILEQRSGTGVDFVLIRDLIPGLHDVHGLLLAGQIPGRVPSASMVMMALSGSAGRSELTCTQRPYSWISWPMP